MTGPLRLLCLGILLCGAFAQAQDSLPAQEPSAARFELEHPSRYRLVTRERYQDYVGFGAGMSTGMGISWRHWFKGGLGVQLNLLPYYHEESYPNGGSYDYPTRDSGYQHEGYLSAGVTVLKDLADADFLRMFGYLSGSVTEEYTKNDYYTSEYRYYSSWDESGTSGYQTVHNQSVDEKRKYAAGIGLGLEYYVWRFAFSGMLGYRGEYDQVTEEKQLGPSVEVGTHFRF